MAFSRIENIAIRGVSACVPKNVKKNLNDPVFLSAEESLKFVSSTGIEERRIASAEICSSDLCYQAAEKLIAKLGWRKDEINCLIFITQTPDYIVPATSCILQDRLGLSTECMAFDITLGCSGWVYGIEIIGSILSSGLIKKGLLLVGETTSKTKSAQDKSTYPLFGDCGTATAIEYDKNAPSMFFHSGTDGSKYKSIYIPDGAFRNPVTTESLVSEEVAPGIIRNRLQYIMEGDDVFIFSITKPPKSIAGLINEFSINKESIDYYFLHQANKIMVDKIRNKINAPVEKVPTSYREFGNTSMSSIPLTIVNWANSEKYRKGCRVIACGFGGGLSWATGLFDLGDIKCPSLFEI